MWTNNISHSRHLLILLHECIIYTTKRGLVDGVIVNSPKDHVTVDYWAQKQTHEVEAKMFDDSSGGGRRLIHIQRSFISSWHMCYYRQEVSSSWRLLTPLRREHPPSLLPHWHWMMLFGLGSISFTGQSSFQHPSTLSWKEALNISPQLLITCNELPWKCVFFSRHTLCVVIGSYSRRIVQCDDGNAAANAHPLPVWASLSHKAAVQPWGGIIFVCVDRYCSSKPSGLRTPRAEMCLFER